MVKETSAGAVIFRRDNGIKYLLLHYEEGHWEYAKGHIEKGEDEEETVRRETEEETGIKEIKFIDGFKEKIHYYFTFEGKKIDKDVFFYLCETKEEKVKLSFEHIGFEWLDYEKAMERLTFKNAKDILEKANNYLNRID